MSAPVKPEIRPFFDEPTNTASYPIWDPATREGAVVDPVVPIELTGDASG